MSNHTKDSRPPPDGKSEESTSILRSKPAARRIDLDTTIRKVITNRIFNQKQYDYGRWNSFSPIS